VINHQAQRAINLEPQVSKSHLPRLSINKSAQTNKIPPAKGNPKPATGSVSNPNKPNRADKSAHQLKPQNGTK